MIAVPIVLALALATSFYGQNESSWLNFKNLQAQLEKAEDSANNQPDKGDENSLENKDKIDQDSKSALNVKPEKSTSKIWRGGPKRLE